MKDIKQNDSYKPSLLSKEIRLPECKNQNNLLVYWILKCILAKDLESSYDSRSVFMVEWH